jgi:hypothetical protein
MILIISCGTEGYIHKQSHKKLHQHSLNKNHNVKISKKSRKINYPFSDYQ